MGPKDASGMPIAITQALVDATDKHPEHKLLMNFNSDGTLSQISNPTMGFMNFTYINDSTIVVKLTLTDTLGSYQVVYNPKKQTKSAGDCKCSKKRNPVTGPRRDDNVNLSTRFEPSVGTNPPIFAYRPKATSVQGNITAVYDPGGQYVTGLTVSAQYVTDQGKKGAVQVTPGSEDGVFIFTMPDNPAPPPPSGFSAKVQYLLNALCWGNIPKGLSMDGICGLLYSEMPNPGSVVCQTMLNAYLLICRASSSQKVSQEIFDLYTSSNITISITAQSSVLAAQTKHIEFIPSGGNLVDVQFTFSGAASFSKVYTVPEAPVAKQGYNIVAILNQTGASGTVPVRLSMRGSDGYTKSLDFEVPSGGNCQLDIPGGAKGVRDDITAQIITGSPPLAGQIVKLHLIFQ
jgi:hypothetical protein